MRYFERAQCWWVFWQDLYSVQYLCTVFVIPRNLIFKWRLCEVVIKKLVDDWLIKNKGKTHILVGGRVDHSENVCFVWSRSKSVKYVWKGPILSAWNLFSPSNQSSASVSPQLRNISCNKHEKYGWQIKKKIVSRKPVLIFQSTIAECKLVLESRWRKEFTIHIVYIDSISHFLSLDPESSPDCNHWYSFFHSITFLGFLMKRCEWMTFLCLSSFKITVPSSGKTRCSGKLSSGQNSQ